jgi:hypothetical protein
MKKCSGRIYKINNKSFCVGEKKSKIKSKKIKSKKIKSKKNKSKKKLDVNKILY